MVIRDSLHKLASKVHQGMGDAESEGAECKNPGMTFPIKKGINTELVIDRKTGTLYTKNGY